LRNLKAPNILDGNYFLDAGAERLSLKWKVTVGSLVDKRDGVEIETMDSAFNDLLRKPGSSKYIPKRIDNMSTYEYKLFSGTLAPTDNDGSEDSEEWNHFEEYMVVRRDHEEDLNDRHTLSATLATWRRDVVSHPAILAFMQILV
jgi:hypothetical protein